MSDKQIQYAPGLPAENIYEIKCPIIYALDIIGQKWKLPIMWYLFGKETTRYNELKRSVTGITNIMLTKSLRELEEHRLVHRFQHNSVPPKVEYSLTERGKALLPTLNELYAWGEEQYNIDHTGPKINKAKCAIKQLELIRYDIQYGCSNIKNRGQADQQTVSPLFLKELP